MYKLKAIPYIAVNTPLMVHNFQIPFVDFSGSLESIGPETIKLFFL
jgi:hypothetical protein